MTGLKEELRGTVEAQMHTTVLKASIIAKVQQKVLDRNKSKYATNPQPFKQYNAGKHEAKPAAPPRQTIKRLQKSKWTMLQLWRKVCPRTYGSLHKEEQSSD